MDISEIWDNLPYVVAPAIALTLGLMAFRMKRRWVRFSAFAVSLVLFLLAGLTLALQAYVLINSTARRPNVISPDGKHVAVTRWLLSGAIGCDHAYVSIRSRFSPIAKGVDFECAPPAEPRVQWLDDHHLLITYWEMGEVAACSPGPDRIKGIQVLCRE
jgi:hypothetical protein